MAQPDRVVARVLDAIGQGPKLAPAPMLERQANQRSDESVDRYRAEAQQSLPAPERRAFGDHEQPPEGKDVLPSARGG